jgi:hypothetical protein
MVRHFPNGAKSEDLRRQYERDTSLVRQSFYNALSYVKTQGWFVREEGNRLYHLNSNGSWKEPVESIGDIRRLEKTQLEKLQLDNDRLEYLTNSQTQQIEELQSEVEGLRDWSNGGVNGVAVSNLAQIVGNSAASTRQRIKACGAILAYKVHDDAVTEFVKRFLETVCASADISADYRIEAGELLRRHEAPRVMSESVRPTYRGDEGSEAQRVEAWRRHLIDERKWKLARETHNVPHWSQWAADLYADDFVPPQSGWPPQAAVGPDMIKLHIERSELMRRARRGNGDDASEG